MGFPCQILDLLVLAVVARIMLSSLFPGPVVQAGSSGPWVGFEALPTELLQLIFKPLFPRPQKRVDIDRTMIDLAQGSTFFHDLIAFAKLRLVCVTWNEVMTPILYEEIIIFTYPFSRLQRMVKAFDYGAPHIRSVVLCGSSNDPEVSRIAAALVGRGLALCSHIRNLECNGSHCIFTHRRWLQKTAPQLSSTVTSLTITGGGNDLSHSLIGLGRNLQSLEIRDCSGPLSKLTPTFHLPKEMPNLTHVTIRDRVIDPDRLQKLFERILIKREPGVKKMEVPLRSLALVNVSMGEQRILALLKINHLCHQLTSLYISSSFRRAPFNPEFSVRLVEACPMLTDFHYVAPMDKEIFQHLRPNLRHLGLLMDFHTQSSRTVPNSGFSSISIDDLTKYLRSERARSLETLYIALTSLHALTIFGRDTSLKSVCGETGVSLLYAPR